MTIKVERETLLRLLSQPSNSTTALEFTSAQPLSTPLGSSISRDDYVHIQKPLFQGDCPVGRLRESSCDDDSVYTVSTASISSDSEDEEEERTVSFAETLVTEEWTRPYTPREEIANLYYSTEETQRFRQEYRMERKLLSELSVDPDSFPVDSDELSSLLTTRSQQNARHRISRVVVVHNDRLETFFNTDETISFKKKEMPSTDDFFDSDSFWSGSITWY